MALSLMNLGFVSINRTRKILAGFSPEAITLSEGYLAKLQKRYSKKLKNFVGEVKSRMLSLPLLYWDHTVIFVDTARACMRFYGNEKLALYTAHLHKDLESLMNDNILPALSDGTVVMHDHNTINYHQGFVFRNVECIQHLERDLQKIIDVAHHPWASEFEWVKDFSIPTTNNLSERSLRFVETKDKVSGQFQSSEYASYFADIRTYLGTCARNGVNEFTALLRLTSGQPYKLGELLGEA